MGRILSKSQTSRRLEQHTLNDKQFKFICRLVYEATGIVLDERKREMVYRRLMRRTRDLKIESFGEYCALLKSGCDNELPKFINSITTNLTSFFRENHHFDYLKETFIPEHLKHYSQTKKLRIWSAACSTGEEPYSLAITVQEAMGSLLSIWDTKILATDLDTDVLAHAKAAVYKADRIEDIAASYKRKWFKKGSGDNINKVKVHPKLAHLITFKQLNLLDSWPVKGPFDVIVCRNVLIYFDRKTQKNIIDRYYDLLRPGGLLILGHSESLAKDETLFSVVGRTIFKKPQNAHNSRMIGEPV